jgi:tetratricopeptide (TPR) repeat protein
MGDSRGYDEWARRLAAGDWIGRDVFYQAPLYPYFLGVIYALAGRNLLIVRVVQALLGSAACVFVALAASRFFSPRIGIVAGIMLALYAPAIFFDGLIQKSVLDVFFLSTALWLLSTINAKTAKDAKQDDSLRSWRPWRSTVDWLCLGLAIGALTLTRENAIVFTAVISGWALIGAQGPKRPGLREQTSPASRHRDAKARDGTAGSKRRSAGLKGPPSDSESAPRNWAGRAGIPAAATFLAGVAIVVLPVAIRNSVVSGGFYVTTSQFGPNFYIGNNARSDGTYQSLRFGRGAPEYERQDATEIAERATGRTLTPAEVSSYWTDQALDFIGGQPAAWLRLMARKALLLVNAKEMLDTESQESHAEWSLPLRITGIAGHFGVLVPIAVFGLAVSWPTRARWWILLVLLGAYAASVVMFYVFARYRYPLVPMLIPFAAAGLVAAPAFLRGLAATLKGSPHDRKEEDARFSRSAALSGPRSSSATAQEAEVGSLARSGSSASLLGRRSHAAIVAGVVAIAILSNGPRLLSAEVMRAVTEHNLGAALQSDGRFDEAMVHYKRALAIKPDYAPAYNNLASTLRARGQLAEAVATYQEALRLRPDYPEAHYNLANALLDEGKPDEAVDHFERALQSIGGSADVHNNLGIALSNKGRLDDAIAEFRRALQLDPDSAKAHRNLGSALAATGARDEALEHLRRAVAIDPNDGAAHYDLGSTLLEAGRADDAIAEFRAALRLDPNSVEAHNNLGIALGSTGKLDEAIAEFEAALKIKPDFADARRNLAMARGLKR